MTMPTIQSLHDLLAYLFESGEDARQVIVESGLDPRDYVYTGSAKQMWIRILEEANRRHSVPAIIVAACRRYPPREEELKLLEKEYHLHRTAGQPARPRNADDPPKGTDFDDLGGDASGPQKSKEVTTQLSAPTTELNRILIVTVTKVEAQAVLETFAKSKDKTLKRRPIGNNTYYKLGIFGGVPVFMVQSEMGSATPGGALLTVRQAIQDLRPQAVIMCGVAFGLRPDKQKLGDILVAKQIQYYEPQKVDLLQGQQPRGDRVTSAERLLDRFRSGDYDWQGAQRHFGLVLSGEKLVNVSDFRDWLLKTEPEAVGGEMEGAGLYAAARDAKVDWILVKAICDWADGNKNDDVQPRAARNAAQFVLHVLQLGGWGTSEQLPKKKVSPRTPLPKPLTRNDKETKKRPGIGSNGSESEKDPLGPRLFNQLLENYERHCAHAKTLQPHEDESASEKIERFDAETIIRWIRSPKCNRTIMELSGPAGLGKSHLQKIIFNEADRSGHESSQWGKWKYVVGHPLADSIQATFPQIMVEFWRQFLCLDSAVKNWPQALGQAIQRAYNADKTDHFIFWIDDGDLLNEDVLIQLLGDDGPVGKQVRKHCSALPRDAVLRLVIATRHRRLTQAVCRKCSGGPPSVTSLPMDPFELQDVKDMVYARMPTDLRSEHPTLLEAMAWRIMEITGGHPRAINHVLYKLKGTEWGLAPEEYAREFRPDVLAIIMRDVIGDLPKPQFLFYYIMSVFRSFRGGDVHYLLAQGLLPEHLVPETATAQSAVDEWLLGLSETPALIRRPEKQPYYSVHPVLRHVFQIDLAETHIDSLRELHQEAWAYYHQELTQQDPDGVRYSLSHYMRPSLTLDALYHAAQEEKCHILARGSSGLAKKRLQNLAREYWQLYARSLAMVQTTVDADRSMLKVLWQEDQELREVIEQLPSGTEIWTGMSKVLTENP